MLDLAAAMPPPTKQPRDENFPVASRLLAPAHREAVLAFYRFVRAADDVADSGALSPEAKLARLDRMEAALLSGDPAEPAAARLHAADRRFGAGSAQARQLLQAFRQDASLARYPDWDALLAYCALSANPVGRFLLRLHGEGPEGDGPADALCTALQILNHLQDLARDRDGLDRVYLPVPWMERAGGEARFFDPEEGAARRPVLDAALDRVDALIDEARALPRRLASRRLALQSRATIALACALSARLRAGDPILRRIEVSRGDVVRAFAGSPIGWRDRDDAVTRGIVGRSGSSFSLGMRSLTGERRRAIHAVYAFCRLADDVADGAAPPGEKRRFLDGLRREVDRLQRHPETPVGRELARAQRAFALPADELHALLDGMETDGADRVRLADDAALDLYARRVAGSVGALSIRIFGAPEAEGFALGLGRTLQIVNILRDVDDDARIERVYLPLSRLAALGLADGPARSLVADPRFAAVCEALAQDAAAGFVRADADLERLDRRALKPAILMMEAYRRILDRLLARGWTHRGPRLRLTPGDRIQLLSLSIRSAP